MPDMGKKEFTFMNEQIRKKPFYRKKWFLRGVSGITLAILFGGVAGIVFAIVQPWGQKQFGKPDEPPQIVWVQDETEPPTEVPETEKVQAEVPEKPQKTIIQKKELEIVDYKQLYNKMYDLANEASKSIVTVTGESSGVDWLNQVIQNQVQASGLAIAQNKQELFILTEKRTIEHSDRIVLTFANGSFAEATLQKQDDITEMAVVKVALSALDKETRESIVIARIGTSLTRKKGEPVIAVGSPFGISNSMAIGMITSVNPTATVDQEYDVITTDIIGSEQGSGVLIDLNGKIVGIIAQKFGSENEQTTVTSLAAADTYHLIELLAKNSGWTYMGVTGKEISENLAREKQIPKGIFVIEVAAESPAWQAGILGSDIITSINGKELLTMEAFVSEIQTYTPGEVIQVGIQRGQQETYVAVEIPVTLGEN